MNFDELVSLSGDSILSHIVFDGHKLRFELALDAVDELFSVSIVTSLLQTDLPLLDDHLARTCRLQVVDLVTTLDQTNGYFVPPTQFPTLMKDRNSGVWLSYGAKAKDAKFLISAIGYSRLFSCVIRDLGAIEVMAVEPGKSNA